MINFNIQRFAPSGSEPLTIIWDDNNNKHSLRPLSTDITVENYTFSQEQNNQMLFLNETTSAISDKDFSFKGKTNYTCIPGMKQIIQNNDNLSGETIYFDFPYCYNNMDKQFHLRLNESSKILKEELLEWLGESSSPAGDVKKDFIVGTTDTLKVYWDHIAQFGISFEGSSASTFNSWIYSIETMNESYYPDGGFSGNLIGTVTSIDTSCPLYNLFFHSNHAWGYTGNDTEFSDYGNAGMWIYTFIEKEFIAPFGYTIDSSEDNVIANILGMKIGSHNILEVKKGNSLVKTFHDWREPKLGDDLNGQTIKIVYPSGNPIYNTGYETSFLNNEYIVTDGDYMIRETGTYDQVDSASDYSWVIEDYIYSIEIVGRGSDGYFTESVDTIYKTTTRIKTTYGSGGNPTQQIQSQTEDIRKKEITLPSDIGTFVSVTSNMGITFQVDDLRISTKSYSLQSLQGTDNLQNKMILISSFPTNVDKVWFPSLPSMNEYGQFNIPSQYTLFSGEKDFTTDYYVYMISVSIWPTYDSHGKPSAPYSFVISGQNMGGSSTICAKTYGSSDVNTWNKPIIPNQAPQSYTLAEAGLKTSSPLYPYIKKLVWNE